MQTSRSVFLRTTRSRGSSAARRRAQALQWCCHIPQGGSAMREAVIVEAIRTPLGRGKQGGALAGVHPVDLLAHALKSAIERTGIDPLEVDDVIAGCVSQVGEQAINVARNGWLAAGFPVETPGTSVD